MPSAAPRMRSVGVAKVSVVKTVSPGGDKVSPARSAFRATTTGLVNCAGMAKTCTLPSVERMARIPMVDAVAVEVAVVVDGVIWVDGHHLMARMLPHSVPMTVQSFGLRFIAMVRIPGVGVGLVGNAQI